jgi:phage-related minor tail protein
MSDDTAGAELDRANADRARQLETLDRLAGRFGTTLSAAFARNASAGRQLDGVLGQLGTRLASAVTRAAAKPLAGGIQTLVKGLIESGSDTESLTPLARGGVLAGGRVVPFAKGGVVAAPTYFPMAGGLGLMGERGAEAVMPLARGPDGRLGVAAGGAGGRPVSVNVTIATPDAESFRRSQAQVAAGLARAVARGQRAS